MKVRIKQTLLILILIMLSISGNVFADINSELRIASAQGQISTVKELIRRGADVNAGGPAADQVPEGTTALMLAAAQNFKDVVNILISAGANPNQADKGGATPLIYAVWKGRVEIIKILLEHGANVNARTVDGRTPLSVAESCGHLAIAKILKNAGATH